MWSWDAAFVAVGLATMSVQRAVVELDTLLSAQWANGMIPHIVSADGVDGYFPGADRWDCARLAADAPGGRQTSGITQAAGARDRRAAHPRTGPGRRAVHPRGRGGFPEPAVERSDALASVAGREA